MNRSSLRKMGRVLRAPGAGAFTLLEILIAISIFSLVLAAIYSTWTAILRASKVGIEAAAVVQRSRIALSMLEESLGSAQAFSANQTYYAFESQSGSGASLSFVARLAKSFPRSGKFGDLDVRRVTFAVEDSPEGGRQLVLRQNPILMELDKDEKEHPLVIAKNVKGFDVVFWDQKKQDWIDEWTETNSLPKVVKLTLQVVDKPHSLQPPEEITRIIGVLQTAVPPNLQRGGARPGGPPGANPPGGNPAGGNPAGGNPAGGPGIQFPGQGGFGRP
jgi:general secretion pathway protein J